MHLIWIKAGNVSDGYESFAAFLGGSNGETAADRRSNSSDGHLPVGARRRSGEWQARSGAMVLILPRRFT